MTTPTPSASFRDAAGRTWHLLLTIGRARAIREATGVDVGRVEDGAFFLQIRRDPEKFASVLWLLCEKQAELLNPPLTPAAFVEALDGNALDAAREAISQAVISFTPAAVRGALEIVLRKTNEAEAAGMQEVASWAEEKGSELAAGVVAVAREAIATHGKRSRD